MAKHKKKHSKKDSVPDGFLDVTALSIKKYRKVTNEIAKLSTSQKVVGSLALLMAGYFYLDKVKSDSSEGPLVSGLKFLFPRLLPDKAPSAPRQEDDRLQNGAASYKSSKPPKASRTSGTFGKRAAASEGDL